MSDDARGRAQRYAPHGLVTFGDDGRIVFANAQLHAWMKVPEGQLAGRQFDHMLAPASRVFHSTHFFPLLKLHAKAEEVHLTLRTGEGVDVPVIVSAVREAESGVALNHCVLTTMRRRIEFENALLEARRAAEEATRAKDQFLGVVSHELRTPLGAITGWAHLARTQRLEGEALTRALETIERNAQMQARLIDDLLDVSRIVSGRLRLSPRPIQLAPLLEAAIDTVRPTAQTKNITIVAAIDRQAGIVFADADRVQQIAWNLIANAVKFTPKGGKVQVALHRADSRVHLAVADTGRGIAPAALPYVFDRFWQGETGREHPQSGLGLGLSICKSLVELHGGTIAVESDGVGLGARFCVEFPLAVAAVMEARPPEREAPTSDDSLLVGVDVLVVDDDEDTRHMLKLLLETAGAVVRTSASSEEALDEVRTRVPHVLVSDLGMPGADGAELIAGIRNADSAEVRALPAIAVTGLSRPSDRIRVLRAGFQAHLAKPVEPAEVLAVVGAFARRA